MAPPSVSGWLPPLHYRGDGVVGPLLHKTRAADDVVIDDWLTAVVQVAVGARGHLRQDHVGGLEIPHRFLHGFLAGFLHQLQVLVVKARTQGGIAPDDHGIRHLVVMQRGEHHVVNAQRRIDHLPHVDELLVEDANAVQGDHHDRNAVIAEGDGASPERVVHAFGGPVIVEPRYPDKVKRPIAILIGVGVPFFGLEPCVVIGINPGVIFIHERRDVAFGHAYFQHVRPRALPRRGLHQVRSIRPVGPDRTVAYPRRQQQNQDQNAQQKV